VNVWCGLLGNKLIEPFISDHHLRRNICEMFLRSELQGLLDVPLMMRHLMYSQHDGAPPHYSEEIFTRVFSKPFDRSQQTTDMATEVARPYPS
jgi:hypothetical protein